MNKKQEDKIVEVLAWICSIIIITAVILIIIA